MKSKYLPLWNYIKENCFDILILSFSQIEEILSFPIDHSFLTYKSELLEYGCKVEKVFLKKQEVLFKKINDE